MVFLPLSHQNRANAGRTLLVMALLMGMLFLGSLGLTHYFAVMPQAHETILSALARRMVGNGFFYYLVQFSTLLVLAVAANTSFSDFPRLASILARDRFLPRQLTNLGDRLVFANGMLLLAGATAALVVASGGVSHDLVPLFAVGAFMAFTLSQSGMVLHWARLKGGGWRLKSLLNGLGTLGTGVMLVVVGISKFTHGAWLTLLVIPLIVWIFLRIHAHFEEVPSELTLRGLPPSLKPVPRPRVVVPISGVHRGTVEAINYARSISRSRHGVLYRDRAREQRGAAGKMGGMVSGCSAGDRALAISLSRQAIIRVPGSHR